MREINQENKMSTEEQQALVDLHVLGYPAKYIQGRMLEDYEIKVSLTTVYHYTRTLKWRKRIDARRAELDKDIIKHPLYSKVSRLNYLKNALDKCLQSDNTRDVSMLVKQIGAIVGDVQSDVSISIDLGDIHEALKDNSIEALIVDESVKELDIDPSRPTDGEDDMPEVV